MDFLTALIALTVAAANAGQPGEKPSPPTKIAYVDLRKVYDKNEFAKLVRTSVEADLQPYYAKAKTIKDELEKLAKNPEANRKAFRRKNAELKALGKEARDRFEEKFNREISGFRKDFEKATTRLAEAYGFSMVLTHGVPDNPFDKINANPTVQPSLTPVYVHCSVNLTEAVIATMRNVCEHRFQSKQVEVRKTVEPSDP